MRVYITQLDGAPPIPASVATGIVAQPGGQSGATPLPGLVNVVTGCAPGCAVILVVTAAGRQRVFARAGRAVTVFPALATQIEGNGVNVAMTVADGGNAEFVYDPDDSTWLVG